MSFNKFAGVAGLVGCFFSGINFANSGGDMVWVLLALGCVITPLSIILTSDR